MSEDDEVSPFSDIDIHLLVDDALIDAKPGKLRDNGVLLEISVEPFSLITDLEATLSNAAVASSMARNVVLHDPEGCLQPAFDIIAGEFPRESRVVARMDAIQARIERAMAQADEHEAFHDQVMRWIFPAGVTTHLLLAAGLGNPTVRRRFVEVGKLLAVYRESETLDLLLGLINCAEVTPDVTRRHLRELTPIYDHCSSIENTTSRWKSDVSADARTISIDGTRNLIESGFYRESMFWMVATFTRCLSVIAASDDTSSFPAANQAFLELMSDLDISSTADIVRKKRETIAALPGIREVANRILDRNPDVIRG